MRDLIDGTRAGQGAPSLDELRLRRDELLAACARKGASNVWVFGSVARGDADEESDLDLLADIKNGRNLFALAALIYDIEDALGCPVNVVEYCVLRDDRFGRNVRRDMVRL